MNKNKPNEISVLMDSDLIVQCTPLQIKNRFEQFKTNILLSTEVNAFPKFKFEGIRGKFQNLDTYWKKNNLYQKDHL